MTPSLVDVALDFLDELSEDKELLEECKKNPSSVYQIARKQGYMITEQALENALIHLKRQKTDELSEEELEQVAGGIKGEQSRQIEIKTETLDSFLDGIPN